MPLWLRAFLMMLLFPGVVAGLAPRWVAARWPLSLGLEPFAWIGWAVLVTGLTILLLTIWDFLRIGRGTLAPWDAPSVLVDRRLYRWTRNPMYLGVLGIVLGQALLLSSGGVLAYFAILAVAFHVRVTGFEEPALLRQFGSSYQAYLSAVPRWLPRPPSAQDPP